MLNENLGVFVEKLRTGVPEITAVQVLTVDGLTLVGGHLVENDDQLSAVTALLCNGAEQVAACFADEGLPQGTIVCTRDYAYTVIRLNDELALGIKAPLIAMQQHFIGKINAAITSNMHCLAAA